MKIYTINGRSVWLNKAPEGYEEPEKKTEETVEPKSEPKTKAKKVSNKSRKEVKNK